MIKVEPVTLKGTPKRFLLDQKAIWTSPLHVRPVDAIWLLPLGAVTGTMIGKAPQPTRIGKAPQPTRIGKPPQPTQLAKKSPAPTTLASEQDLAAAMPPEPPAKKDDAVKRSKLETEAKPRSFFDRVRSLLRR